jgi:hypothetical protein
MRMILAAATVLALCGPAAAQHQHGNAPYAGLQQRPVKALSEQQVADLRAGRGMGLALAAELNGYPGPLHVIELADLRSCARRMASKMRRTKPWHRATPQADQLGEPSQTIPLMHRSLLNGLGFSQISLLFRLIIGNTKSAQSIVLRSNTRKSIARPRPISVKLQRDDLHPSTTQRAPRIRSRRAASQLQTGRARAARDARRRGAAGESAGGAPRRTPVRAAA